ncbi:MAG: OsmC family protein [Actinomycetota bacterium]
MNGINVLHEGGDRYRIRIRGHEVLVDQPMDDGGEDTAPTPTELFVAGLASCVAFYAGRFLRRHDLPAEGLAVECGFTFASDRPARVGKIEMAVRLPEGFPEERRQALLSVVEHCTVHNSLQRPPEVGIALEP